MDTIFMNSKNSKTSDSHRLLLSLTDEINFKRRDKYIVLSNLSIYYTWKKLYKKSYKDNKFRISAQTKNLKYLMYQDYFEYIYLKSIGKRQLIYH